MKEVDNILVPKENVNDEYVIINQLYFKDGDKVSKGDIIADIETSKTNFSIESPCDGYVIYFCKEGHEIKVGNSIAKIFDSYDKKADENFSLENKSRDGNVMESDTSKTINPVFSKAAIELIEKYNISQSVFTNKEFVTQKDIEKYLMEGSNKKTLDVVKGGLIERVNTTSEKLTSDKKREIYYLSSVQSAGLTCTFSINVNSEEVLNYTRKEHSIFKLTLIPTLIQVIAKLLEEFPVFNAYYDNDTIVKYNNINIGYAIDMNFGLKVITLYNTNKLSLHEIEQELQNKIDKYLNKKLEVSDLSNATFTITDLSNTGIHYFRPLINKNQSAIIGISSVDFKTNSFNVSLTFDHRVTEGKTVSSFLNKLKNNIENHIVEKLDFVSRKQKIKKLLQTVNDQIKNGVYDKQEQALILKDIINLLH